MRTLRVFSRDFGQGVPSIPHSLNSIISANRPRDLADQSKQSWKILLDPNNRERFAKWETVLMIGNSIEMRQGSRSNRCTLWAFGNIPQGAGNRLPHPGASIAGAARPLNGSRRTGNHYISFTPSTNAFNLREREG